MPLSIGIVGLPNVGKSTLFQTITKKQVDIANYPFCTIDPNVGVVAVPDERVDKLSELTKSAKKIYTTIEFYDIAGLVRGAYKGEGLGNKFLANIRETDAIVYVLRAFLNPDIIKTLDEVNPLKDKEILETELILKDLETLQKNELPSLTKARELLEKGEILFGHDFSQEESKIISQYQLLTMKPRLYLLNGKDEEVRPEVIDEFKKNNWPYLIVDIATEFEAAGLTKDERISLGITQEPELDALIKKAYDILGLLTFFTTGPDETRAWTIKKGDKAPKAGGAIHSDFESNFIRAEVINCDDLLNEGGFAKAREKGLIRTEGKEYVVKDGDVIEIKHGS